MGDDPRAGESGKQTYTDTGGRQPGCLFEDGEDQILSAGPEGNSDAEFGQTLRGVVGNDAVHSHCGEHKREACYEQQDSCHKPRLGARLSQQAIERLNVGKRLFRIDVTHLGANGTGQPGSNLTAG